MTFASFDGTLFARRSAVCTTVSGASPMTDKTQTDASNTDAPAVAEALRTAQPGVKDSGDIVTGAGGEMMSGLIADIADGDT